MTIRMPPSWLGSWPRAPFTLIRYARLGLRRERFSVARGLFRNPVLIVAIPKIVEINDDVIASQSRAVSNNVESCWAVGRAGPPDRGAGPGNTSSLDIPIRNAKAKNTARPNTMSKTPMAIRVRDIHYRAPSCLAFNRVARIAG
jgi:hypothetical protein